MARENTHPVRFSPRTAQRLKVYAATVGLSMSAATELLMNLAGVPRLDVNFYCWSDDPACIPFYEAVLKQATEAGNVRFAEFLKQRIESINAITKD